MFLRLADNVRQPLSGVPGRRKRQRCAARGPSGV